MKSLDLILLIGPGQPLPVPRHVINAVTAIEVTSGSEQSGFSITFATSKDSKLLTTLLPAGYFDPITTRVIIMVTLGGFPHVLMDGVVVQQEVNPSSEPGQSTLTIRGKDLSVLMDIVEVSAAFPQMDDQMQAYAVLAPFGFLGVVPLVIPGFIKEVPNLSEKIITKNGTALTHLKNLATNNGFVFYIEPGPLPGQSIAYLGPEIRIPVPQAALSVNMDAHTNVEDLNFTLDGLAKETLVVFVNDPVTKKLPLPIPIPSISIFQPPLGARPTATKKLVLYRNSEKNLAPTMKKVLGRLLKGSANAITASGSLDVLRYGHVLRSRALVGVRGAGLAYDGLYYVDSVTHRLKPGEFKQSFTLSRDGLVSLTPRVPV